MRQALSCGSPTSPFSAKASNRSSFKRRKMFGEKEGSVVTKYEIFSKYNISDSSDETKSQNEL